MSYICSCKFPDSSVLIIIRKWVVEKGAGSVSLKFQQSIQKIIPQLEATVSR